MQTGILTLSLPDEAATLALGRALALTLPPAPRPALLLQGELGSGKTTLVRGLVAALPGGEQAETSSPSFTLYNLYPTRPEIAHFDLYRLDSGRPDEEYCEWLSDIEAGRDALIALEWPERLSDRDMPGDYLLVRLEKDGEAREAVIEARGEKAGGWIEAIKKIREERV